jgi:hypothetical protein
VTFIYPDHFVMVYKAHPELRPAWYVPEPFHNQLLTRSELPTAVTKFGLDRRIAASLARGSWVGSYLEAHIWCECPVPSFRPKRLVSADENCARSVKRGR